MAFSLDLRERVVSAIDNNMHINEAVKIFNVCRRTIYEWLELRKEIGNLKPKSGYQKGHSHKIKDWENFKIFAANHQQCSIPQMVIEFEKFSNIKVSESVMFRALKKINYTSKKKHLITPKPIKKNGKNI